MNCTELDAFVDSLSENIARDDVSFGVGLLSLFLVSFALLTHGERLVRPLAAVLGGVLGGGGTFLLTRGIDISIPCEARLAVAAVAGVVLAVLAMCVLKTGLFLLGALGLGATAHLVWESLPLDGVAGPFTLAGRAGWYYIVVGGAALTGAVVSQLQKKRFTRIASSVLGGSGLAVGVHLMYARNGTTAPPALLLGVVIGSSIAGSFTQHYLQRRRKRTTTDKRAQEMIPVGHPVA